jgi:hypothetical protein
MKVSPQLDFRRASRWKTIYQTALAGYSRAFSEASRARLRQAGKHSDLELNFGRRLGELWSEN